MKQLPWLIFSGLGSLALLLLRPTQAVPQALKSQIITCDVLVVGGGLAGVATAYEALQGGRTVCLTELTDWLGGQISAQGTSALDESQTQRSLGWFPRGYSALRQRILDRYDTATPGNCWVSEVCFLPQEGHEAALALLQEAATVGGGTLKWFPNTVIKSLQGQPTAQGELLQSVEGIQHTPAPGAPALNTLPLSQTLQDAYSEQDSALLQKTLLEFAPPPSGRWLVVEATETGELLALADLPYQLGIDPRSVRNPSASATTRDPYCPQGFTYTFAMEATPTPVVPPMPSFYPEYASYYSFELPRFNIPLIFTYRRIQSVDPTAGRETITPGDISMQNWTWGNDYRPGTPLDNLIYSRDQLVATGQLEPGGWQGGLRVETLAAGEALAQGYFYWLAMGTTDSQLGENAKQPYPRLRYLQGLGSPMGTVHGLSKYPYIREGRRLIARQAWGYPAGFQVNEIDISRKDFQTSFYQELLSPWDYNDLQAAVAGLNAIAAMQGEFAPGAVPRRQRSRIYSDSVGIGSYAIDFHPCMALHPPQQPGNYERPGERWGAGSTYPFQIPLRAMIPPRINNLLVTGKSIATSHISAAAYRVHTFEWSAGAAAGTTAVFALEQGLWPYQLTENLPRRNPQLEALQRRLNAQGNPTAFPGTSIFE
jgi:hypothetical protein